MIIDRISGVDNNVKINIFTAYTLLSYKIFAIEVAQNLLVGFETELD